MGVEEFIGEVEAAQLSGVNTKTLNRFALAGYLKPEVDSDGFKLYSKRELCSVFRIKAPNVIQFTREPTNEQSATEQSSTEPELPNEPELSEGNVALKPDIKPLEINSSSRALESLDYENERLRAINAMSDQLLEHLEKRIHDLTKERDWLRAQIEQLNEQVSRDQVLLLTQSQTIAEVLSKQLNRPSLFTKIVGLLGFEEKQKA